MHDRLWPFVASAGKRAMPMFRTPVGSGERPLARCIRDANSPTHWIAAVGCRRSPARGECPQCQSVVLVLLTRVNGISRPPVSGFGAADFHINSEDSFRPSSSSFPLAPGDPQLSVSSTDSSPDTGRSLVPNGMHPLDERKAGDTIRFAVEKSDAGLVVTDVRAAP